MKLNFFEHLFEKKQIITPFGIKPKIGFLEYFYFETLKEKLLDAIKTRQRAEFVENTQKIIELIIKEKLPENVEPLKVLTTLFKSLLTNDVDEQIMFIKAPAAPTPDVQKKEKNDEPETEPWTYPGRLGAQYINLLSSTYGWTIDEINRLDVNVGLFLIQEILASRQYEAEDRHRYSELAYKYDKGSQKSIFQPLPRPRWMDPNSYKTVKREQIFKNTLPFGNVIDTTGFGKYGEKATG